MLVILWILSLVIIVVVLFVFVFPKEEQVATTTSTENMQLTSSAFMHNESIPSTYTCDGADSIPPLSFGDVPENTQSLALIMEDPDVPVTIRPDGIWDHWIVFNIPPAPREIQEGSEPEGVQGTTNSQKLGHRCPCPPEREPR